MANTEDKPIPGIPLSSDLTNAKILGIDHDGSTKLFTIANITGNYKGIATPSTNPGVATLAQFYSAFQSGTYVNFLGVGATPVVIPAPGAGQVLVNAQLTYNGSYWVPNYVIVDFPLTLSDYLKIQDFSANINSQLDLVPPTSVTQRGTLLAGSSGDNVTPNFKFNNVVSVATVSGYIIEITIYLTQAGTFSFAIGTSDGSNFTIRKQLADFTGVIGLNTFSLAGEAISSSEILALKSSTGTAKVSFATSGLAGNHYTLQNAPGGGAASNGVDGSYYAYGFKVADRMRGSKLYDVFMTTPNGDVRYLKQSDFQSSFNTALAAAIGTPGTQTTQFGTLLSGSGNDNVNGSYKFNSLVAKSNMNGNITELTFTLGVAGTIRFAIGTSDGVYFTIRKQLDEITGVLGLNTIVLNEPISAGEIVAIGLSSSRTAKINFAVSGIPGNHYEQEFAPGGSAAAHGADGSYYAYGFKVSSVINPIDSLLKKETLNTALKWVNDNVQLASLGLLQGVATDYDSVFSGLTAQEYFSVTNILPYTAMLKSIAINVGTAGTITFAIGLLDQTNKMITDREFTAAVVVGLNNISVNQQMASGQQLFIKAPSVDLRYKTAIGYSYWRSSAAGYGNSLTKISGAYLSFTYTAYQIFDKAVPSRDEFNVVKANVNTLLSRPLSIVAPNGQTFRIVVSNSGVLSASPSFSRMLVLGNSITQHPITSFWWGVWGMAATVAANDFCHKLAAKLLLKNGAFTSDFRNVSTWESSHASFDYTAWDSLFTTVPDLVVIRLVENVNTGLDTFGADYLAMINYIKSKAPNAKIIATGSFWKADSKDAAISTAASTANVNYLPLSQLDIPANEQTMGGLVYGDDGLQHAIDNTGVAHHPNDTGHSLIADTIYNSLGL